MHDWIGVDFDGTLAKSTKDNSLGAPVAKMVQRIKHHILAGDTVKIFTARMEDKDRIKAWTKKHLGCALEVTDRKDHCMRLAYDDKIKQVVRDQGTIVGENSFGE